MVTERFELLKPLRWLPDSLATKARYGFRADSRVEDGSECTTQLLEELALCDGSIADKVYTLYACGVTGYEGKTFSPKQLMSMVIHRDPFRVGQVCRWVGGIRTESGIIYGPSPEKKQILFESLCDTLDEWNPLEFKGVSGNMLDEVRTQLGASSEAVSDYGLSVYLVANYAQFVALFIHPFWNRNGRISEEMMHLFCLSNCAGKRVFWEQPNTRYNLGTSTRMEIINRWALVQLAEILKDLGVTIDSSRAVTGGYEQYFSQAGGSLSRLVLKCISPYHYRFVAGHLTPTQLRRYFQLIEGTIEGMIAKLKPCSFKELSKDKVALDLLDHHLQFGRPC